jgi:hypothetical protein
VETAARPEDAPVAVRWPSGPPTLGPRLDAAQCGQRVEGEAFLGHVGGVRVGLGSGHLARGVWPARRSRFVWARRTGGWRGGGSTTSSGSTTTFPRPPYTGARTTQRVAGRCWRALALWRGVDVT